MRWRKGLQNGDRRNLGLGGRGLERKGGNEETSDGIAWNEGEKGK